MGLCQPGGGLVGGEHQVLDQLLGLAGGARRDVDAFAVGVEGEFGFDGLKFHVSALGGAAAEYLRKFACGGQCVRDRRIFGADFRVGGAVEQGVHLAIYTANAGTNNRFGELIRLNRTGCIQGNERRKRAFVVVGLQRTNAV